MTTKNQCCIACEARHGGHKWCKKPTCKCHTPKTEETVEEQIQKWKVDIIHAVDGLKTTPAEEVEDVIRDIITSLHQKAEVEEKELVEQGRMSVLEDFDSLMKADAFMGLTGDEWKAVQKFFRYNDEISGWNKNA